MTTQNDRIDAAAAIGDALLALDMFDTAYLFADGAVDEYRTCLGIYRHDGPLEPVHGILPPAVATCSECGKADYTVAAGLCDACMKRVDSRSDTEAAIAQAIEYTIEALDINAEALFCGADPWDILDVPF